MRLFTGLSLPPETATMMGQLCQELRAISPGELSWTPVEKFHITTKFIGEFPEGRLAELRETLSTIHVDSIDVRIQGLGWLPNTLCASVELTEPLIALVSATETALEPLAIATERRPYRPHVTLARACHHSAPALREFQSSTGYRQAFTFGIFRVAAFSLYLSTSGKYTELNKFTFSRE
jgi:RNA 2',3'-cyclic 3'-phosphodiesterase